MKNASNVDKVSWGDFILQLSKDILENIRAEGAHAAAQFGEPESKVVAEILAIITQDLLPKSVTNQNDKRSTPYRVRLTIFQRGGLVADTDPELPINMPGTEIIRGLQAVGEWAREIVEGYHGERVEGLGNEAIARSIKSLRPSLSRNKGVHNWRLVYTLGEEQCMANILVVTEAE